MFLNAFHVHINSTCWHFTSSKIYLAHTYHVQHNSKDFMLSPSSTPWSSLNRPERCFLAAFRVFIVPSVQNIFPCSSVGKESACSEGDPGLIPWSGRSPGGGNGNPLQYPCLEKYPCLFSWTEEPRGLQSMGSQSRARLGN